MNRKYLRIATLNARSILKVANTTNKNLFSNDLRSKILKFDMLSQAVAHLKSNHEHKHLNYEQQQMLQLMFRVPAKSSFANYMVTRLFSPIISDISTGSGYARGTDKLHRFSDTTRPSNSDTGIMKQTQHYSNISTHPGDTEYTGKRLEQDQETTIRAPIPKKMFYTVQKKWGRLTIDVFAARHNHQLPTYWTLAEEFQTQKQSDIHSHSQLLNDNPHPSTAFSHR
jgi:hypothetical protein